MDKTYNDTKILSYQGIIFCGDQRRTREEMLQEFGEQATEFAEILEALDEWSYLPKPLSTPRRIFVSYRHADDLSDNWVRNLVRELRDRSNEVVFDNNELIAGDMEIPRFIAKLAKCHLFLFVIDPLYMQRIQFAKTAIREHGWASSEFRIAKGVGEFLRIPLLGFLREGNDIPKGMSIATDTTGGGVVDVRTPEKLQVVLNHFFGNTVSVSKEKVNEATQLVHDSEIASESGDDYWALRLASRAAALVPEAVETHLQLVIASLWLNELNIAKIAAGHMMQLDKTRFVSRYLNGLALVLAGKPEEALNILLPMRDVEHDNWRLNVVIAMAYKKYGLGGNAADYWEEVHVSNPAFAKAVTAWSEMRESPLWFDVYDPPPIITQYPRINMDFVKEGVICARLREVRGNQLITSHIEIPENIRGARTRNAIDQVILSRAAPFLRLLDS